MNRKFLVTWIVAFVVWMIGSFVVHGTWLSDTYAAMTDIMRPQEEQAGLFHLTLLAHVLMAGAFVWIYQRGIEDKPWIPQGVRFGIAIALLAAIPTYTIYYVVQKTPGMLAVQQSIGDTLILIFVGLATAFMSREPAAD